MLDQRLQARMWTFSNSRPEGWKEVTNFMLLPLHHSSLQEKKSQYIGSGSEEGWEVVYTVQSNRNMPGTYTIGAETKPVRFVLQGIAAVSLLQCERDPSLVDQVTFLFYMLSRLQSLLHGWSRNSISFSGCLIPVAQCLLSSFACSETHSRKPAR